MPQHAGFEAGVLFAGGGHHPRPGARHAIRAAVDEALAAKARGSGAVILFNLSGHGHFDMAAYDRYLAGQLGDYALPDTVIRGALATPRLPQAWMRHSPHARSSAAAPANTASPINAGR